MKTTLEQAHRALLLVLRRRLLWKNPLCINAEGSYIGQPIVYINVDGGDQHGADLNETRLPFHPPLEPLSCIADSSICFLYQTQTATQQLCSPTDDHPCVASLPSPA